MKKPSDENLNLLKDLIGFGESSSKKTYYTELQDKISEIEVEKNKYKQIFENSPIGIVQTDLNNNILMANSAIIKLCGFLTQNEFIENYKKTFHLFKTAEEENLFFEQLKESKNITNYESIILGFEKEIIVVLSGCFNNNIFELFIQDITQTKKLQVQLLQSQKLESIGTLAAGISHDFNNILGILFGNIELSLEQINSPEKISKNLEEMKIASKKAQEIVKQLLSFSRNSTLEKKPLYLNPIIKESIKLLRSSIPKSIEFIVNLNEKEKAISANPTQMHQILLNLATNSMHAMEENGGVLKIETSEVYLDKEEIQHYYGLNNGYYLMLTVSDTGYGIPKEIKDKIFDPYFTTKPLGKGTGMGLSVVNGIVKSHNGIITVYSEVNKGTVFKVLLPIIEDVPVEENAKAIHDQKGSESILLVDDEEQLLKIETKILEHLGYKVISFFDSEEALFYFSQNYSDIDLVITDMTMPKINGKELSEKMLLINNETLIIICTGFNQKLDSEKALNIGVKKYIEKPFDIKQLSIIIREVLDN